MPKATIIELDSTNTCEICDNALFKYTCPKCSTKYCSLTCYQSEKHLECSETFYKDCIGEQLAQEKGELSKQKMLEILQRTQEEDELDSDDEEVEDIAQRLKDVDLDNADAVWDKLTADEQQEFVAFLKSGDVSKLIPSWEAWWAPGPRSVEDVAELAERRNSCPSIVKIRDFGDISKKPPADCVKFNLINVIGAYAFAARYFYGEHHDFCKEVVSCIVAISLCLKSNQNFEDFDTAVKSVEFQCIQSDWIVADAENFKLLREDLSKILQGPSATDPKFYVLAALSDLHNLLTSALLKKPSDSSFSKKFPNDHFPDVKLESKNKIRSCLKKVEYLLSFAKDFTVL